MVTRESEPTKKFISEDTDTPLKKPVCQIVTENLDEYQNKTALAKRIEADKLDCKYL